MCFSFPSFFLSYLDFAHSLSLSLNSSRLFPLMVPCPTLASFQMNRQEESKRVREEERKRGEGDPSPTLPCFDTLLRIRKRRTREKREKRRKVGRGRRTSSLSFGFILHFVFAFFCHLFSQCLAVSHCKERKRREEEGRGGEAMGAAGSSCPRTFYKP